MTGEEEALADPAGKRVLIVDDDDSILSLLSHVVGSEGFQVETASDGEEGLKMIERNPPDLVILDLMMPKYGGFEALRRLQEGPTARIPIIVVTGRYTDRSTAELIRQESNVTDFLEKPVKLNLLSAALHRALRTRSNATP